MTIPEALSLDGGPPLSPQLTRETANLFPLKVEPVALGEYQVTLLNADGQPATDAEGEISDRFRWELTVRVADMDEVDAARTPMREGEATALAVAALARLGRRLHHLLFDGKVGVLFARRRPE